MAKIIRTPTKAHGGITLDEKRRMDDHVKLWTARAFRTDPIEPEKIVPAIEGLYAIAGLKTPRVVIVPSPLVMAFAYGAASAILHTRNATYNATLAATHNATHNATRNATLAATHNATYNATLAATSAATLDATDNATYSATLAATDNATLDATYNATLGATHNATRNATLAATDSAAEVCKLLAGSFGLECAIRWSSNYQGGNTWASYDCYLTAARDILGLQLPSHAAYAHWEQAAIHGGFRVMHEDFCMVSDFPEFIRIDDMNRPHCETGPSHRWRDGWSLYHWHGVSVPAHWIEQRATLDPNEVIKVENVEQRAVGAEIVGWPRMLDVLKARVIHDSGNDDMGQLIELTLPGLREPGRFLKAKCPRNGIIVEGVPYISDIDGLPIDTALAAQAWRVGDAMSEYEHPTRRT